ncbi:UNVERIFIED_CONTAM: signal transduction histidine kinase [Williamsia faeni]
MTGLESASGDTAPGAAVSTRVWDAYVASVAVTVLVLLFVLDDRYPGSGFAAGVVIITLTLGAMIVGGRWEGVHKYSAGSVTFAAVVVIAFAVALWLAPASIALLPALFPMFFRSLPIPGAVVGSALVSLTPVALSVVVGDVDTEQFTLALVISLISLVVGPVIGVSITWVTDNNLAQATLLHELEASRVEVERLSRASATALERARLAREIHDTIAQGFTCIVALAQAVEPDVPPGPPRRRIGLIESTARENLAEARVMVAELTPSLDAGDSLTEAIERHGERVAAATGMTVTVTSTELPPLTTAVEVALLRAAQEGLSNARRHAAATTVDVAVVAEPDAVSLRLADNGIGFDPDRVHPGFGLRGMRERVAQVGGSVAVESVVGAGTTLCLTVPL